MAASSMELSAPGGTPWGPIAAVVLCFTPVLFLLATTLYKPLFLRSSLSLPLSALLLAFVRLAYLSSPALLVLAHVAVGALQGLVPLAVTFGAILLFEVMAATGCLQYMMGHVRRLSAGNRVAEVFLIGWAFAYTISGVSGLSTPMALATPMLVSLGHDPLLSLVAVIGLNGAAAHLGSVGMTIWFGFRTLNLTPAVILQVGAKSSVLLGACAFVVAPVAASFLVPWKDLACNAGFILVSVASAVVPTVLMAMVSAELPVIIGGLVSMLVSVLLVKHGVGLCRPCALTTPADVETGPPSVKAVTAASAAPTSAASAAVEAQFGGRRHIRTADAKRTTQAPATEEGEVDSFSTAAVGGSMCSSASSSSISAESSADSTVSVTTDNAADDNSAPDDCSGKAVVYIEDETVHYTPCAGHSSPECQESFAGAAVDAVARHPTTAQSGEDGASLCLHMRPCCGCQQDVRAGVKDAGSQHCQDCAAAATALACRDSSGKSPAEGSKDTMVCTAGQQQHLPPAQQDASQLQQQQQRVLPLVYVGNRATGDHVVVSGFDKLPEAVRLLLRPGYVITTHGRFQAPDTPPAELPRHCAKHQHDGAASQQLGNGACDKVPAGPVPWVNAVLRTLPIWLTVVLLLVTRVPVLRLQDLLRCKSTSFTIHLGTLGSLSISPALVLQIQGLFTQSNANWTVELLYMPCLIPFVLVSCVTLMLFGRDMKQAGVSWRAPFATAWNKLKGIVPAMLGALVLAQLMSAGGQGSPAYVIAYYLTTWMGKGYLGIAGFLGAVGSFVSGSVMAGNMTQGAIQATAAARLGVPVTSMLAVQVAGACAGKMVCVSSILSAKVVLSELRHINESEVIIRIGPLALLFVLLAQVLGLMWTLGGVWPDAA